MWDSNFWNPTNSSFLVVRSEGKHDDPITLTTFATTVAVRVPRRDPQFQAHTPDRHAEVKKLMLLFRQRNPWALRCRVSLQPCPHHGQTFVEHRVFHVQLRRTCDSSVAEHVHISLSGLLSALATLRHRTLPSVHETCKPKTFLGEVLRLPLFGFVWARCPSSPRPPTAESLIRGHLSWLEDLAPCQEYVFAFDQNIDNVVAPGTARQRRRNTRTGFIFAFAGSPDSTKPTSRRA